MEDRKYPSSLLGLGRVVRFLKLLPSVLSLRGEGDAGELASEGSILRVVGCMEGHCWSILFFVGFGIGVRYSKSLLRGLPPPTLLYFSSSSYGFTILGSEDKGRDEVEPVQSDGVVTSGCFPFCGEGFRVTRVMVILSGL